MVTLILKLDDRSVNGAQTHTYTLKTGKDTDIHGKTHFLFQILGLFAGYDPV